MNDASYRNWLADLERAVDQPVNQKPCRSCGFTDRNNRGDCKECKRRKAREWASKNPDEKKARAAAYYQKRKDFVKSRAAEWAKKNPEKTKAAQSRWKINNPEKHKDMTVRASHSSRAEGKLSIGIVEYLMERQGGLCACCRTPLNGKYHLDHIMPIALGGMNTDDNVQLLTPRCNRRKGNKHPSDYINQRAQEIREGRL